MGRFTRNVLQDALIVWPLIYFGLYLQMEYVYNLAVAFFWVMNTLAIVAGLGIICSEGLRKKKDGAPIKPRMWIHRKYSAITAIAEIAAMFALGYFFLASYAIIAALILAGAYSKIEEGK